MEGISHESASLAGTLGLGKLIVFYDDNLISLDGATKLSFTEDVHKRFEAYNWQVLKVADGNDLGALDKALAEAKADTTRPTLIQVRTIIGYGSPKAGSNKSHGEPLGAEAVAATKKFFGFPEDQSFVVPEEALKCWRAAVEHGKTAEENWTKSFAGYKAAFPELAAEFERTQKGELKAGWEKSIPVFPTEKADATRSSGGTVLNALAAAVPELMGGAADLTSSTKTIFKPGASFLDDAAGRNVFWGVREFGMCAAVNGIAAHGGLIPFGSTFFVFSDYCKPAIRLAALMQLRALYVFTHDSIAVGEDGPTHEPIEQLAGLRAIPGLLDLRPADANETAAAWRVALERQGPSFFALSRQNLPVLDATKLDIYAGVSKGAYVVQEAAGAKVTLLAAGSELWLALEATKLLAADGVAARVVSCPSTRLFDEQTAEYKAKVLPKNVPVLAIEAGVSAGWWKYAGSTGDVLGLDHFGASAPGPKVAAEFGFTAENVAARAKKLV
jgi:transketolase